MQTSFILTLCLLISTSSFADTFKVSSLKGELVLIQGKTKKPLKAGDTFEVTDSNQTIETGANSEAVIVNPKNFGSKLYASSALTLTPDGKELKIRKWNLNLTKGAVLMQVMNPNHIPGYLRLKTRVATMGVRGTTFYVRDEAGKPEFFCPCQGEIELHDGSKPEVAKAFHSKHHDAPSDLVSGKTLEVSPTKQAPEHSDEEIEGLKTAINQ